MLSQKIVTTSSMSVRLVRRGKINNNENDLTCSSLFHFAQLCMLASLPADWKRYIQFHFLLIFQATLSALTRLPTRPSLSVDIYSFSYSLLLPLHITCFDWSIRCESLFSALCAILLKALFFMIFRCLARTFSTHRRFIASVKVKSIWV